MRATSAHPKTAADDLDMEITGIERSGEGLASGAISVCRVAGRVSGQSIVAPGAAVAAIAGGSSITVPAGRTSSRSWTLAVRMLPSRADFHRSSDAPGDQ